jgi:hypothetical protein
MNEAELRLAIEEPATRAGAEFEPGLVDKLLEAIHRQPGALPLLEHALKELWNKREDRRKLTHDAYKIIGGLEGALERRANEVLLQFSPDDQDLCRRVFLRLVHPGGGAEDTRRRVLVGELLTLGDASRIQRLIAALTAPDARLIVTEGGSKELPAQAFVEVAHETLIRSGPSCASGWTLTVPACGHSAASRRPRVSGMKVDASMTSSTVASA